MPQLHDHQPRILVRSDPRQLIRLAENQPARIIVLIEQRPSPRNRRPQPLVQQLQPCGFRYQLPRHQPQRDFRRRTVQPRPQQRASSIRHRNQPRAQLARPLLHIGPVHPHMPRPQPIRRPPRNPNSPPNLRLRILRRIRIHPATPGRFCCTEHLRFRVRRFSFRFRERFASGLVRHQNSAKVCSASK